MDFIYNVNPSTQETKKIILVGNGGVGKTTFVKCLLDMKFDPIYNATLGADVYPLIDIERNIKYNIWDIAGQEIFGSLRESYYLNSDLAILMFSVDNKLTFKSVKNWYNNIKRICPNIPVLLISNKINCENKITPIGCTLNCKKKLDMPLVYDILANINNESNKKICLDDDKIINTESMDTISLNTDISNMNNYSVLYHTIIENSIEESIMNIHGISNDSTNELNSYDIFMNGYTDVLSMFIICVKTPKYEDEIHWFRSFNMKVNTSDDNNNMIISGTVLQWINIVHGYNINNITISGNLVRNIMQVIEPIYPMISKFMF